MEVLISLQEEVRALRNEADVRLGRASVEMVQPNLPKFRRGTHSSNNPYTGRRSNGNLCVQPCPTVSKKLEVATRQSCDRLSAEVQEVLTQTNLNLPVYIVQV